MHRLSTASLAVAAALVAASGLAATLNLSAEPSVITVGSQVTFTFSPVILGPEDSIEFDFGDGATATAAWNSSCSLFGGCATITHTYVGTGTFTVAADGTVGGVEVAGSTQVTVEEVPEPPASTDLYVLAAAHSEGSNSTVWRSDVELQNYGNHSVTVTMALLGRNHDNSSPQSTSVTLGIRSSIRLADVLAERFGVSNGAAALRLTPSAPTLAATSRTYNAGAAGTYGQFVPAVPVGEAIADGQVGRLLQLSHDPSLAQGFRTNLGLLSATSVPLPVRAAFYLADGRLLGTVDVMLAPYEFRQLDKAFEQVTDEPVPDGYILVSTTLAGGRFFAYASVVDNLTGDPTLVPSIVTP